MLKSQFKTFYLRYNHDRIYWTIENTRKNYVSANTRVVIGTAPDFETPKQQTAWKEAEKNNFVLTIFQIEEINIVLKLVLINDAQKYVNGINCIILDVLLIETKNAVLLSCFIKQKKTKL